MDQGTREERSPMSPDKQTKADPDAEVVTEEQSSVDTTQAREEERARQEAEAKEREEQEAAREEAEQPDPRTPEEIREDIRQTRVELGDTAEQLAAKADVKGQAKAKVDEVKGKVSGKKDEFSAKAQEASPAGAQQGAQQVIGKVRENPAPAAIAAAVLAGFVIGRWIR